MALIIRIIGWGFALASVATFASLGLLWFEGKDLEKPWGEFWFDTHPASLNLLQAGVQRYLNPDWWDEYAVAALQWPMWGGFAATAGVLLVLALLFVFLGRRRRRPGDKFREFD